MGKHLCQSVFLITQWAVDICSGFVVVRLFFPNLDSIESEQCEISLITLIPSS